MSKQGIGPKAEEIITFEATFQIPLTPDAELRKTRKKFGNKIMQFENHLAVFVVFILNIAIQIAFKKTFEYGVKHRSKADMKNLHTFISHNEVMSSTSWSCLNEFLVFLSELQTAAYSGAARTLRCILETAVEACDFQSEKGRPTYDVLIKEYKVIAKTPKKKERLQSLMMQYNAWISFMERYKIYEQTKRIAPSFKELVNRLNSRKLFQETPQIVDAMKMTYEELSDYVHPSFTRIEKRSLKGKAFIFPRFDSGNFDVIFKLGLKTLDIVQFLYIKSISHFFDYKNAKEFLQDTSQYFGLPTEIANLFLTLPFSSKLSEGIRWQLRRKNRKSRKSAKTAKTS